MTDRTEGGDTKPLPHDNTSTAAASDIVAAVDTGARIPKGLSLRILVGLTITWSLFQLWYASPLPFMVGFGVLNDTEARSIHLAFSTFLAYLAFPAFKTSPRRRIPVQDWIIAAVAAFCAGYLFLFYVELSDRPGLPTTLDVAVGAVGMVTLLEATRRALGPPLMVVAGVFMVYAFAGPYMPDVIAHQGASVNKGMSHYWLGTEGVFGVALGVSTTIVFLFVLFGALLDKAGAGNYFIRVAFSLMGHMRGGPAKAAVVSSAMTGLISGSSIANVVTTGPFTIPLMRKVGFPAEKAGAVEVASSTNGQLSPPVMGTAAYLMVEYVGISINEVMMHAILPAAISYIALVYIVHLEAVKANIQGLPKVWNDPLITKVLMFLGAFIGMAILSFVTYFSINFLKSLVGEFTPYVVSIILFVAYLALLKVAAAQPDLDTSLEITELPLPGPTVKAGLYFLLPVIVLLWLLVVERLSPSLAAFWATAFMIFITLTHKPLIDVLRGQGMSTARIRECYWNFVHGLEGGARNMIGIGVATAAAGIVVGTITLTGLGQVMIEMIEIISGGNLMAMLVITAVICLILGMGLPTTANYIVVSSLMAPVIVTLGAQSGLIVPLIAVHMFVFYFGILADDTPPVGLAAFAAAAISGGDPIRTGVQGFTYDIRTAILPFIFIFNTQLLMIGIDHWWELVLTIVSALVAMLTFAAATQRYFLVKCKAWEVVALLLVAFTLFRPGYWMDMIYPPLETKPATDIYAIAESLPEDAQLRVRIAGLTLEGDEVEKIVMLPMGQVGPGDQRLMGAGLELVENGGDMVVDNVVFGSVADKMKIDFDWVISSVEVESDRPAKEWMFLPALVLYGLIILVQRARRREQTALAGA